MDHPNKELERLLTTKEVADKLGIHPKTLMRWTREGAVPGIKFGRYWVYRVSVLEEWIETLSNRGKL